MEPKNNQMDNKQPEYYDINHISPIGPFPPKPASTFKNYHDFKFESMNNKELQSTSELQQLQHQPFNQPNDSPNKKEEQPQPQPQKQILQKDKEDPMRQYQSQLKRAYDIFLMGEKHWKAMNFHYALDSYTNSLEIAAKVYPNIVNDQKLKPTTDNFLKTLNQKIEIAKVQIKNRFEVKTKGAFDKELHYSQIQTLVNQEAKSEQNKNHQYVVKEIQENPSPSSKKQHQPIQGIKEDKDDSANDKNQNNNKKKDGLLIVGNDLREKVLSEIVDSKPGIAFDDVIGLGEAKQTLREIIIIPNLRPDLFTGLRSPPRGLLLFGPPGTGKTMIAKAVATECKCTFFNISASSLTSKYVGESEKLVRALFELANEKEPSVVFIDEIESILSKRNESENEAMKRLKTEFLIQFDGVGSNQKSHVLIIGATNRPQELDPAVIRRLPKRVFIGPFDEQDRKLFVKTIVKQNDSIITDEEYETIAKTCTNYSNSDLKELCREAAYEPLREISGDIERFRSCNQLRPICYEDFEKAIKKVRGTLTAAILDEMEKWNKQFGALN